MINVLAIEVGFCLGDIDVVFFCSGSIIVDFSNITASLQHDKKLSG